MFPSLCKGWSQQEPQGDTKGSYTAWAPVVKRFYVRMVALIERCFSQT
jgi:hypothetical protein